MTLEEVEAVIIEKAAKSPKAQLYLNDFYKCDPDRRPKEINKIVHELVTKGKLQYWSSGSSTQVAHPDRIKNEESTEGVN